MRYIPIFISFWLVTACNAKKTTTTTETKIDSLRSASFEYVSKPIETTIYFPDLCDTITNKPRQFKQIESSGNNKAKVSFKDNNLLIDLLTEESKTKIDTIIEYKYRDKVVEVDKLRYKTPLWMWITIIFSILLNIILLRFTFFR